MDMLKASALMRQELATQLGGYHVRRPNNSNTIMIRVSIFTPRQHHYRYQLHRYQPVLWPSRRFFLQTLKSFTRAFPQLPERYIAFDRDQSWDVVVFATKVAAHVHKIVVAGVAVRKHQVAKLLKQATFHFLVTTC